MRPWPASPSSLRGALLGLDDGSRQRAAIEGIRPPGGNQLQGFRQVGLHQPVAFGQRHAAGAEDCGGFGMELRAAVVVGDVVREKAVDAKAVLGEFDRRRQRVGELLRAPAAQRGVDAAQRCPARRPPGRWSRRAESAIARPSGANMSALAAAGARSRESTMKVSPVLARWTSMKPPPPMPDDCGSTTLSANCTAAAASMALPPCASMRAPAAAAAGCDTATTPSGEAASTEAENRQRASQRVQCGTKAMGFSAEQDRSKPAPMWRGRQCAGPDLG